jgi:hypothetical protein
MEASATTRRTAPSGLYFRVLIALPPDGLGRQGPVMRAWLNQHCGPEGWSWAVAGTDGIANDAVAYYFRDRQAAQAFVRRFACGYRPPR